jgi:hypothetical protein
MAEHRFTFTEEARAHGLDESQVAVLSPSGTDSLDGLLAFRQGLMEAADGPKGQNPNFPEHLRTSSEYLAGAQVVAMVQGTERSAV